jgi:hypothetical protein
LDLNDDVLYQKEYIPLEEGPLATQEKTWLTTGEDNETDEKYEWVKDILYEDQADTGLKCSDTTYFSIVNTMREPMLAGSQAWNSYGNRTNLYLLTHYGFAFQDNLNNSFQFYVRMNVDLRSGIE